MEPSILFLGSDGMFSRTVLRALLAAERNVVEVWQAGTVVAAKPPGTAHHPPILLENLDTLSGMARAWGIPLRVIGSARDLRSHQRLSSHPLDIILVACFPFRLPNSLLALPSYGGFNLHPSLLPAYRGPTPLFWQLRAGLSKGGITLHVMTEILDAGDIIAQESLTLSPGTTAAQANQRLAEIGGRLTVGALAALRDGTLRRWPQQERYASYYSWPKENDFCFDSDWSAERAFRFIRGTAEWGRPYQLRCDNGCFCIAGVTSFSRQGILDNAWEWRGAELWIQLRPGVLRATGVTVL